MLYPALLPLPTSSFFLIVSSLNFSVTFGKNVFYANGVMQV